MGFSRQRADSKEVSILLLESWPPAATAKLKMDDPKHSEMTD